MKGDMNVRSPDFNRATQINPKLVRAYTNRGIAKEMKGDLDGAMAGYNRTIGITPKYTEGDFV